MYTARGFPCHQAGKEWRGRRELAPRCSATRIGCMRWSISTETCVVHHVRTTTTTSVAILAQATTDRNTRCFTSLCVRCCSCESNNDGRACASLVAVHVPGWLDTSLSVLSFAPLWTQHNFDFGPVAPSGTLSGQAMEFKGLPQFERDFASFFMGLLAALVVAAFVPLAATPLRFAATTCGLAHFGRAPGAGRAAVFSYFGPRCQPLCWLRFVIDFVPYFVSLLWNAGKLVGHAAVLPRSGIFVSLAQFMTHSLVREVRVQLT